MFLAETGFEIESRPTVKVIRVRAVLLVVEIVEIRYDHRNRKCDGEDSRDCAHRSDQFAPRTDGSHVAVPHRRHGNDRPPEGIRNAPEVLLVEFRFGEVDGAGEQDDADHEEEDEEAEFAHACLDGLTKDLESL